MSKENKKKVTLLGSDGVQDADLIIASDKNNERKEAFREAYKKAMRIVPDYFMTIGKRKRKAGSTSSGGFSQNIIVTPENVKVETKEVQQEVTEKEDRERED